MQDENSSVGVWLVVIGVVMVMFLFWFVFNRPIQVVNPAPVVFEGNNTSSESSETTIKETIKEVIVTLSPSPTKSPTATPTSVK